MVGLGPRSAIERAEIGNSRPTVVRACALLDQQRRQMRAQPHHLEQLGNGQDLGNIEIIPPDKDRSDRSNLIYLPNGYQEVKESLPQRHEVAPTQATVGGNQVQNPVKDRTPI